VRKFLGASLAATALAAAAVIALIVVLVVLLVGSGDTTLKLAARPEAPPPRFDKSSLTADAGDVKIDFTNPAGAQMPHNVVIEGNGVKEASPVIQPGNNTSVTADLDEGTYTFYCAVGQHRANGMEGTLVVK